MRDLKDQFVKYPLSKKERANYLIKLQEKEVTTNELHKSCLDEIMSEKNLLKNTKQSIMDIVNLC